MGWFRDPVLPTVLIVVALVLGCAWLTRQQTRVWTSDLTLWASAVEQAPLKPRPALNYGGYLAASGRFAEARAQFLRAKQLAQQPHILPADRQQIETVADFNLEGLAALEALSR